MGWDVGVVEEVQASGDNQGRSEGEESQQGMDMENITALCHGPR